MVKVKNKQELELMKRSGQIAGQALKLAMDSIRVGVSGLEVDEIVKAEIYRLGGDLSYKTVPGYKWATCVTVNEQVVHGIPTERKFKEGDLVSVDLAVMFKGWHTDCAWSKLVKSEKGKGESEDETEKFLKIGEEALDLAIKQAVEGNHIGDISAAIQTHIETAGYSVVRSLVGHGVGATLHEDPEVPGYGKAETGSELKMGMTLAIEVIYTKGHYEVILEKDGWTVSTADGSLGGLFEMTIVVGEKQAQVLTDWIK